MNKTFIIVLVIVIVVLGGYFLLKNPEVQTPSLEMPIQGTETPEMVVTPMEETKNVITYSDTGYSPNILEVEVGTTVTFKNNSTMSMWPASAMHPTHAVYPTTGGCLGSTFDACKGVLPQDSWSFKFDIVGSWKYHDHLKPTFFGTIVVK